MLLKITIFFTILGAIFAQNEIDPPIPVPPTDPGIPYNRSSTARAPIVLEAFIELNCGDSAAAFPELIALSQYYASEIFDLVFQQLPLPYHRNAFLQTQGLYLTEVQDASQVFNYMQAMLDNTFRFSTGATALLNEVEVIELIAETASAATGIDQQIYENQINFYVSPTIEAWKFATRRGMAGTPMYFLNGVDLAINPSVRMTTADWIAVIDPLIDDLNN